MNSRIYYANPSHLDGLVIWSGLPPLMRHFVHPVVAKDYWIETLFRRYFVNQFFCSLIKRAPNGDFLLFYRYSIEGI